MENLILKNVFKKYKDGKENKIIINDFSFVFPNRGLICLVGESGCGKSTFLSVICGVERKDKGHIYNNKNTSLMLQGIELIEFLNVKGHFDFFNIDKSSLNEFNLEKIYFKYPYQLSKGQKQIVSFIIISNLEKEFLLLDEPTSALDEENSKKVFDLVKYKSKDRLIILVTHDNKLANEYSNFLFKMNNGNVEINEIKKIKNKVKNYKKIKTKFTIKNIYGYLKSKIKSNKISLLLLFLVTFLLSFLSMIFLNVSLSIMDTFDKIKEEDILINKIYKEEYLPEYVVNLD